MRPPLMTTNLSLPDRRSGKVRYIYSAKLASGEPGVLIVATDRISAFVQNSLARYLEAYRRLTGSAIDLERF